MEAQDETVASAGCMVGDDVGPGLDQGKPDAASPLGIGHIAQGCLAGVERVAVILERDEQALVAVAQPEDQRDIAAGAGVAKDIGDDFLDDDRQPPDRHRIERTLFGKFTGRSQRGLQDARRVVSRAVAA